MLAPVPRTSRCNITKCGLPRHHSSVARWYPHVHPQRLPQCPRPISFVAKQQLQQAPEALILRRMQYRVHRWEGKALLAAGALQIHPGGVTV